MDLTFWRKWLDLLLPRSRAWGLVIKRLLRDFFEGLAILPKVIQEHLGSLFFDVDPQQTSLLLDWSNQFGQPSQQSRAWLEAQWAATGGQAPKYSQDILQLAGFDVYVHEWWVPGVDPAQVRTPNPIDLLGSEPLAELLVNNVGVGQKKWRFQYGDGSQYKADQSGLNGIRYGRYDGYFFPAKQYPTPDNPDEYPNYFYVCGPNWPDPADVPDSDLAELKTLIYKLKPTHLRCILIRNLIAATWQDTVDSIDEIQDVTTTLDEIQDVTG